ncbi:hypothetical protein GCM10010124_16480 [Pilimelia terevasa]|uniref:Gram-positive cocci surface proteins LPxTG domain-containing protein n=1 Tax=Pilimelia terevasa TaxID=53372 RepID=A0A8J3BNX0_9ACTN|nr:hypothetical protein [Pilimelia terevasa]GGK24651.1 hypothetical protein GCM10010124_16480 [Pilimelia terevasa]
MPISTTPRRAAYAAAALAVLAALVLPATPASAHFGQVVPAVDCVTVPVNGTYRAVFNYTSYSSSAVTVAVGTNNIVSPGGLNGSQPTRFSPGPRRAAFTTAAVPVNTVVVWKVHGNTATARSSSRSCGPQVSLPADGNGTGPVLALGASAVIAGAALLVRALRRRRA